MIVHGLSIKPGKPTMLAVVRGKPIFGLPGYPTSALTVFKVMVEPILREMAGQHPNVAPRVEAEVRERIYGVQGRKYLLPVSLQRSEKGLVATPVPGGSGAVTSLAKADGYIEIPEGVEYLEEGEEVAVELFSQKGSIPDVVVIGSHSRGMDLILELMRDEIPELVVRVINVGSMNGLLAVKRGEADIAGICLLDEKTGRYNKDFPNRYGIGESLLVRGYERELGLIVEKGNPLGLKELRDMLRGDVRFINRDKGSSVRTLIEMTLKKLASKSDRSYQEIVDEIEGFEVVSKTHRAVVAAVAHGTVNLGVAARPYVEDVDVDFIPVGYECFDFLLRGEALEKKEAKLFLQVLASDRFRERASSLPGIRVTNRCGEPVS